MNQGKICISTCARTAAELFDQIRRAGGLADIVEVRFDCLDDDPLETVKELPEISSEYLFTFRPSEQGGNSEISGSQRIDFWTSPDLPPASIDLEEDIRGVTGGQRTVIRSFHDFSGSNNDLREIYERLRSLSPIVVKIAVSVADISDTIPVWKLLEQAASDKQAIIPIGMGEAGKSTRILGLARGAYMTYASLNTGSETAPGQISADDLIDVYRVKELDTSTDVYGIIAGDTSYSVSPYMHNAAFKAAGLNSVFVPLQVTDLAQFVRRMVAPASREVDLKFKGFSVTNPHKQAIIPHLDEIDPAAREIGAVNTVKIVDGRLHGYNTDAEGFKRPLKNKFGDLSGAKAAVIGAGGAARACIYSLLKEKANVTVFARDLRKAETLATDLEIPIRQIDNDGGEDFRGSDIVVNTTPIGTKGKSVNETVATAEQLRGVKLVYDLTYNPLETRLIREAAAAGAETLGGMEMLVAQGERQFEIWTGLPAPAVEMRAAVIKRLGL
jgi:3-dehydroquinate dehydratase/shikimate dehydrogenase